VNERNVGHAASIKSKAVSFLIGLLVLLPGASLAEHYDITLTVEGQQDKAEASSDDSPPAEGFKKRPVFRGKAGEPLVVQFFLTNVNPHETTKQVTIQYYVMPVEKVGQKEVPSPGPAALLHGSFVMDFKPKGRVGLRQQFRIEKPGIYLLRVESVHSQSDHEHFSAIDLQIE